MATERFVDHETLDWSSVVAATYSIEQSIRYDYPTPITDLRHRLVISPRAVHGDQRRLTHALSVTPPANVRVWADAFGNDIGALNVARIENGIAFVLRSTVVRDARLGPHVVELSDLDDPALQEVRRLTRSDAALDDVASYLRALHPSPRDRAEAIVRYVHRELTYTKNVTDVFTTASVAFGMRRGVCQDYAHVVLALARSCGLTARYVSGHLLGEGATHAWVEFLIPETDSAARVLSFDPTTGRQTNWKYLVVAVGRDYQDVAPTSGVFTGAHPGTVAGSQTVRITSVTLAA